jgi:hypothetical protein
MRNRVIRRSGDLSETDSERAAKLGSDSPSFQKINPGLMFFPE